MSRQTTIYNWVLSAGTVGFFIALVWVLENLDPSTAVNLALFYITLFGTAFCVSALTAYRLRRWWGGNELSHYYLRVSLRQALWLSLLVIVCLIFKSQDWFNIINVGLLLGSLIFLEGYFLTTSTDYINERQQE